MANIDRIVNVQISLNTTGITQLGFSTVLVVGAHARTACPASRPTRMWTRCWMMVLM